MDNIEGILLLNNQNLTVTFSLLSFFFFKKIHAVKCYHKLERGAREGLDLFLRLPPGESYYCVRLGGVWKTIHKKYKLVSLFFLCLHRWISIVSQSNNPPFFDRRQISLFVYFFCHFQSVVKWKKKLKIK